MRSTGLDLAFENVSDEDCVASKFCAIPYSARGGSNCVAKEQESAWCLMKIQGSAFVVITARHDSTGHRQGFLSYVENGQTEFVCFRNQGVRQGVHSDGYP